MKKIEERLLALEGADKLLNGKAKNLSVKQLMEDTTWWRQQYDEIKTEANESFEFSERLEKVFAKANRTLSLQIFVKTVERYESELKSHHSSIASNNSGCNSENLAKHRDRIKKLNNYQASSTNSPPLLIEVLKDETNRYTKQVDAFELAIREHEKKLAHKELPVAQDLTKNFQFLTLEPASVKKEEKHFIDPTEIEQKKSTPQQIVNIFQAMARQSLTILPHGNHPQLLNVTIEKITIDYNDAKQQINDGCKGKDFDKIRETYQSTLKEIYDHTIDMLQRQIQRMSESKMQNDTVAQEKMLSDFTSKNESERSSLSTKNLSDLDKNIETLQQEYELLKTKISPQLQKKLTGIYQSQKNRLQYYKVNKLFDNYEDELKNNFQQAGFYRITTNQQRVKKHQNQITTLNFFYFDLQKKFPTESLKELGQKIEDFTNEVKKFEREIIEMSSSLPKTIAEEEKLTLKFKNYNEQLNLLTIQLGVLKEEKAPALLVAKAINKVEEFIKATQPENIDSLERVAKETIAICHQTSKRFDKDLWLGIANSCASISQNFAPPAPQQPSPLVQLNFTSSSSGSSSSSNSSSSTSTVFDI